MTIWLDGNFWSRYFEQVFIPCINVFCDVIVKRVIPTFANIEQEAEERSQAEYDRMGNLPATKDSFTDMAGIAEKAQEVGIIYYEIINDIQQAILNLGAVGLHHTFEQQLLFFHRRQVLHPSEENVKSEIGIDELKKRLLSGGIDIASLNPWPKVDELRLTANSIKHAEGSAVEQLRKRRPDLFEHPVLKEQSLSSLASVSRVYLPLAGHDLYITVDHLRKYETAVISFWKEFGDVIREHSKK